ncbi:RagB/SusD family nutrient uptake outer membrane protein [Chitinophaga vietnamensis]|uniref:RagB/SusD family nutrient uptake outer membrane protein n=1 Tax=Chitinophaga vietnamensis TaxID=2593957 RepID=UPI00117879E0|nr:RagB/SusD family nutrient uptake outer membrane protein [Chitinophaga vietnamensis]
MKMHFSVSLIALLCMVAACSKEKEYLNEKPDHSLSTVSTLADCQGLLNNEFVFNFLSTTNFGTITADEFHVQDANLLTVSAIARNTYLFAQDIYQAQSDNGNWNNPYQAIYYTNVVLDFLDNFQPVANQQVVRDNIRGAALFLRAYFSYCLLENFSLPYDPATANINLGIPLRLTSDPAAHSTRATVAECYKQILADLMRAKLLLPLTVSIQTKPSKVCAYALLARVYLGMADYQNALLYADSSLQLNNKLDDYNNIQPLDNSISGTLLSEDIFHTTSVPAEVLQVQVTLVDSSLFNLYTDNDLRKQLFYKDINGPVYRGTYDYRGMIYSGLANDEIYLIRAECFARNGDVANAMADLNTLLKQRFVRNTFVPYAAANGDDALASILQERRKELVCRGLRWTDLRRLNREGRFKTTLVRVASGQTYTLPPGDPRYAMPFPPEEIKLSGIPQNVR